MPTSQFSNRAGTSVGRDLFDAARYYLGGHRGVLVLVIIAALVGIGFSWNWLIAAGIAPLLLAALPCLVMCGLGLCMNKLVGSSCASETTQRETAEPAHSEPPINIASIQDASEPACFDQNPDEVPMETQALEERTKTHA